MRRITFVAGVGLIAIGLLGLVLPRTVTVSDPDAVINVAGVAALVAGVAIANRGIKDPRVESNPPSVEPRERSPVVGEDVDELIRYASPPHGFIRERRELRRRTRELATDVLGTFAGLSPEGIEASLSDGGWTDDAEAAAFFGAVPSDLTVRERMSLRLFGMPSFRSRFERALGAIAAHLPGWERDHDIVRGGSGFSLAAPTAGVRVMTASTGETGHWRGVSVIAMAAIGAGVLAELAPLLFGGVVGIAYVAYSRVGASPTVDLGVTRTITPEDPDPGDEVTVRVTIENRGGLLTDLRLIDGVPGPLTVEDGTPRRSTSLRPGGPTTLAYTVRAIQGTHTWQPLVAIARSLNGTYEHRVEIEEETTVTARPVSHKLPEQVPLRPQGSIAVGQLASRRAGEGVEFQSVREYRPGDRRSRIDWRRYARFGDLTTVEFREERATSVVIAVDARQQAYRAPEPGAPHAVALGVESADRVAVSLLSAGHRVGLASIAPDPCWLAPAADRAHRQRVTELLATHPSVGYAPPEDRVTAFAWVEWFRSRIPGDAQVLLVSPLCDDVIGELIVRIEARGHPVTVLSPDPTGDRSLGSRMVGMERAVRIAQLRRRGVTVIDWNIERPLDAELATLAGGWP